MTNLPAPVKRMEVSDLWRSDGVINRTPYVLWGVSLFGIKYGIDSFVAQMIFHHAWSVVSYFFPGGTLQYLLISAPDRAFFATIVTLALPFIWAGVVLTMRRLRAVGLPVWLVYLFFVPFVNLMLFTMLSMMPTLTTQGKVEAEANQASAPPAIPPPPPDQLPVPTSDAPVVIPPIPKWPKPDRSLPPDQEMVIMAKKRKRADLAGALGMTVPPSIVLAYLGIFCFQAYGWGLFIGLPFVLGMMSAYYYGRNEPKKIGDSIGIGMIALTLLGLAMFFFAWEGMACLVMAAPIVYVLALFGSILGHSMQLNNTRVISMQRKLIPLMFLVLMPTLMGAEYAVHEEPPMLSVNSTIDIAAPPAVVWNHVIAFPELDPPAPNEWIFATGIAYPVGATINGAGPGAVRKCRFSTGAFIEPIKVWNAPHLLQFGVIAQPPTMRETSWIPNIHPAHLNGYLDVHAGQFKLEEVKDAAGGMPHTRIVGTTWYKNRMFPSPYWQMWSDGIIHSIHMRVLNHIKKNAEKEMRTTA